MASFLGMSSTAVATNVEAHAETTSNAVNSSSSSPVTDVTAVADTAKNVDD